MTRPADTPPLGAVVADLGANLICVLVILIAIAALKSAPVAQSLDSITARPVLSPPLSGAAQSDLLHHRLRPQADLLLVDLLQDGAFAITANGPVPLDQLPPPWPRHAALFVFAPQDYESTAAQFSANGVTATEMTVPEALRDDNGFSRDFLTLRVTDDPASIREPLLRLLTRGPSGSAIGAYAEGDNGAAALPYSSIFNPIIEMLTASIQLVAAAIAVFTLRRIHRRRA